MALLDKFKKNKFPNFKQNCALLASSVCVGYTDTHMNGERVETIMDFIENLFWGFALTVFALIFSMWVSSLFVERPKVDDNYFDSPDFDLCIKVGCSTLIIVYAFLLANGAKFIWI